MMVVVVMLIVMVAVGTDFTGSGCIVTVAVVLMEIEGRKNRRWKEWWRR